MFITGKCAAFVIPILVELLSGMELNILTVQEMKASLYTLTACSAACLVRMDGLTSPHRLSPGEKQIYNFCT